MATQIPTVVQITQAYGIAEFYYSSCWPLKILSQQAKNWRVINISSFAQERFRFAADADLLILFQFADPDLIKIIEKRKELGRKTLIEYSQNFYETPPQSPYCDYWLSPRTWEIHEQFMQLCDGVIVNSGLLRDYFSSRISNNYYVLGPHLPEPASPFSEVFFDPDNEIQIGCLAPLLDHAALLSLTPVFLKLLENPRVSLQLINASEFSDLLHLPANQTSFKDPATPKEYYSLIEQLHIGIIPSAGHSFEGYCTDITAVELSSRGTLPLFPKNSVYKDFAKNTGLGGSSSLKDLKRSLLAYIKNRDKLKEDSKRCYDYIREHRIAAGYQDRLRLYQDNLADNHSDFYQSFPSGYSEIRGTTQQKTRFAAVIEEAQKLTAAEVTPETEVKMTHFLNDYPIISELAILHLRILNKLNPLISSERLDDYLHQFRNDLRFDIFKFHLMSDLDEILTGWDKLIEKLENLPGCSRDFFHRFVVKAYQNFSQFFHYDATFREIGEKLLKVYPDSAQLQYNLAVIYERSGATRKALSLLKQTKESSKNYSQNKEFFKEMPIYRVRLWNAVLKKRLDQK
jgi:tetratricopeptide (TPR) repeat protein